VPLRGSYRYTKFGRPRRRPSTSVRPEPTTVADRQPRCRRRPRAPATMWHYTPLVILPPRQPRVRLALGWRSTTPSLHPTPTGARIGLEDYIDEAALPRILMLIEETTHRVAEKAAEWKRKVELLIDAMSWFRQQICHRGRCMAVCGRG
jgi:hypothetical protein